MEGNAYHGNVDGLDSATDGLPGHVLIDDDIKQLVDDILFVHNDWGVLNQENVKNNQKYATAWMRLTINPKTGMPLILNINSKEIISFKDEFNELTCVIRVFESVSYNDRGKRVVDLHAEVYDDKHKDIYIKAGNKGKFKFVEKMSLLSKQTTFDLGDGNVEIGGVEELSWGSIPFVNWDYNVEGINALMPIKPFIDLMDIELSDLGNDIEDWREAIWILENYNGQSVSDFLEDLNNKKVIKVNDGGNARPERNEIPYEARLKLYEVLERNIYRTGRGINFGDRNNLGNISGVGLKWSYELLEEKANEIEVYGHKALGNLFKLIFRYLTATHITPEDLDVNDLEFKFTRSLLINEKDLIENLVKSSAFISDRTVLDNLPFVPDTDEELRRLAEEGRGEMNETETDTVTTDAIRQLEREEDAIADKEAELDSPRKFYK